MVLYLLSQKDCYGYELSQIMVTISEGVIDLPIGSLYPTLYKLIDKGYVSDYKVTSSNNIVRVYYHIEESGKERLSILTKDYFATNLAIQAILKYKPDSQDVYD